MVHTYIIFLIGENYNGEKYPNKKGGFELGTVRVGSEDFDHRAIDYTPI